MAKQLTAPLPIVLSRVAAGSFVVHALQPLLVSLETRKTASLPIDRTNWLPSLPTTAENPFDASRTLAGIWFSIIDEEKLATVPDMLPYPPVWLMIDRRDACDARVATIDDMQSCEKLDATARIRGDLYLPT